MVIDNIDTAPPPRWGEGTVTVPDNSTWALEIIEQ